MTKPVTLRSKIWATVIRLAAVPAAVRDADARIALMLAREAKQYLILGDAAQAKLMHDAALEYERASNAVAVEA